MDTATTKLLEKIYFDPKSSSSAFTTPHTVYLEARRRNPAITLKQVSDYLAAQEVYSIHRPKRQRFLRNRVVAVAIDSDWQSDLCDMQALEKKNRGYNYILTVIDVLSKYAWAEPIKKKKPENLVEAFRKILKESDRKPSRLFTDRGTEFLGRPFREFLEEQGIHQLYSHNDTVKASVAERYNRTLKTRLWKFFSYANSKKYLAILPHIVSAINHSYHRSIKMRPVDVNRSNETTVWNTLYGQEKNPNIKFRYKIGDTVRIPMKKDKGPFAKGYEANFSKQIYTVDQRLARYPPVYRVKNNSTGHLEQRVYYDNELVPAIVRPQPTAVVAEESEDEEEKVLPTKRSRKATQRYGWSPVR
jgi:transposase InsO family protein